MQGDRLLARHGLYRTVLEDPEGWIPQRVHASFYRDAIVASGDPALGLAAGARIPIHATRLVGHLASLCRDLREAFEIWGRFSDLVVDATRFGTRSTSDRDSLYFARPPALPPLHDDGPSFATATLSFIDHVVGPAVRPVEIVFTGPSPASTSPFEEAFRVPLRWGGEQFEMRFPPGSFDMPLRYADPDLRARLTELAQYELAMRGGPSVIERVQAIVLHEGFDRTAHVSRVANLLGTTPRTLQRRLREESTKFSKVRDEVLAEAARKMLAEEEMAIADVALRLGFSSRATFHRAVRRWTGKTPVDLRRQRRSGDAG